MKKLLKNPIVTFIIGAIIFTGITATATTLLAKDITFTPSNDNWDATNVKDALDDLYSNVNGVVGSNYNVKFNTYVNNEKVDDVYNKYDRLHMKNYNCTKSTQLRFDSNNKKMYVNNLIGNDICNVFFGDFILDSTRINANNEYRTTYEEDGHDGGNSSSNAIDGSMNNGNGSNWYGGNRLLVVYDGPVYVDSIGVYSTENWGYSYRGLSATLYYSDDDSLTISSDLSMFNKITVTPEKDDVLNDPIAVKRIMLVKETAVAIYEWKCLGYKIIE